MAKKYKLVPLKPSTGSAGEIGIKCVATGKTAPWNAATAAGWTVDLNGAPFRDYYSPEGAAKLEQDSEAEYEVEGRLRSDRQAQEQARREARGPVGEAFKFVTSGVPAPEFIKSRIR